MKKILATLAACLIVLGMHAQISQEAYKHGIKTNIPCSFILAFILNWGVVWEGKPVTRGYSEQSSHLPEFSATGMEILPCVSIPQLSMPTPL